MDPIRDRRANLESHPERLDEIIETGNQSARTVAKETMELVRDAIRV